MMRIKANSTCKADIISNRILFLCVPYLGSFICFPQSTNIQQAIKHISRSTEFFVHIFFLFNLPVRKCDLKYMKSLFSTPCRAFILVTLLIKKLYVYINYDPISYLLVQSEFLLSVFNTNNRNPFFLIFEKFPYYKIQLKYAVKVGE